MYVRNFSSLETTQVQPPSMSQVHLFFINRLYQPMPKAHFAKSVS